MGQGCGQEGRKRGFMGKVGIWKEVEDSTRQHNPAYVDVYM